MIWDDAGSSLFFIFYLSSDRRRQDKKKSRVHSDAPKSVSLGKHEVFSDKNGPAEKLSKYNFIVFNFE